MSKFRATPNCLARALAPVCVCWMSVSLFLFCLLLFISEVSISKIVSVCYKLRIANRLIVHAFVALGRVVVVFRGRRPGLFPFVRRRTRPVAGSAVRAGTRMGRPAAAARLVILGLGARSGAGAAAAGFVVLGLGPTAAAIAVRRAGARFGLGVALAGFVRAGPRPLGRNAGTARLGPTAGLGPAAAGATRPGSATARTTPRARSRPAAR